jgi:hypothetical protein
MLILAATAPLLCAVVMGTAILRFGLLGFLYSLALTCVAGAGLDYAATGGCAPGPAVLSCANFLGYALVFAVLASLPLIAFGLMVLSLWASAAIADCRGKRS